MEKNVGAYEARRRFGQLLEEAYYQKDSFIIERAGRPMAVMVSIDEYQKWRRLAKERVFLMLNEVWSRTQDVPAEELEADVKRAVETLRQELLSDG